MSPSAMGRTRSRCPARPTATLSSTSSWAPSFDTATASSKSTASTTATACTGCAACPTSWASGAASRAATAPSWTAGAGRSPARSRLRRTTARCGWPAGSTSPMRTARPTSRSAPPATCGTTRATRWRSSTLATLAAAPFNKLRMCVFPKHYDYNHNEPEHHPFERDPSGSAAGTSRASTRPSSGTWSGASPTCWLWASRPT